jgi:hypothetical protein
MGHKSANALKKIQSAIKAFGSGPDEINKQKRQAQSGNRAAGTPPFKQSRELKHRDPPAARR